MKMPSLSTIVLDARLALGRVGIANVVTLISGMGAMFAWLWLVPHAQSQVRQHRLALEQVQRKIRLADKTPDIPTRTSNEERLAGFYDALGERRYAEQQVKTIFAVATKTGLTLNQAEYKSAFDKNGRFHTYQITLPIKGSYSAVRQFSEQLLLALPFASLDQVNFKRDAIANNIVEAQLRLTLYLTEEDTGKTVAAGKQGAME